jgi:uncharacterized protein (TIRG00374 family)
MMKKRSLVLVAIPVILGVLVYLQFRTWRRFDWGAFASVSSDLLHGRGLRHILIAVLLIYFTYWLRAVRWKLFLKPVRRARLRSLVPTQYIGFMSLALLGRPGELIRPYLIARKENLTVSSQIAVWTVERIFDIGAFAVLLCIDVFYPGQDLPHMRALKIVGGGLLAFVAAMAVSALLIRRNGPLVASWLERRFSHLSPKLASSVCNKIRSFGEGLNTIQDGISFLQLAGVSLTIWFLIAVAYRYVLHAYPQRVFHDMGVPQVFLLMACSMVGSMIQLPAVGGGSQLAVISMLSSKEWFDVHHELAVSAGMLLWLVTFMAVIPIGLALAHQEHLSLRKLSEETHERAEAPAQP